MKARERQGPGKEHSLLSRLQRVDSSTLADAGKTLRILPALIRPMSAGRRLVGRALTAYAQDDLLSVLCALYESSIDDVLVIATGGSPRAVAGELFAAEARRRGLAGIVVDGFCRDTATLERMELPFYALGATPRAAGARVLPQIGVPINIGDVQIYPRDILVGDNDGIIVGNEEEMLSVIDRAEYIQQTEDALRSSINSGEISLFERVDLVEHVEKIRSGRISELSFDAR